MSRRRKNEIKEFVVGLVLFCTLFILLPGIASYVEHHYTRDAEVVEIVGDVVVVEDACGFEWEFYGSGFAIGDKVEIKMFTNFTHEKISDDEIEKVEKRG